MPLNARHCCNFAVQVELLRLACLEYYEYSVVCVNLRVLQYEDSYQLCLPLP